MSETEDVCRAPEVTTNFLSVSQLIKKGNKVLFKEDCCEIYNKDSCLLATALLTNGVYKLNTEKQSSAAAMI